MCAAARHLAKGASRTPILRLGIPVWSKREKGSGWGFLGGVRWRDGGGGVAAGWRPASGEAGGTLAGLVGPAGGAGVEPGSFDFEVSGAPGLIAG